MYIHRSWKNLHTRPICPFAHPLVYTILTILLFRLSLKHSKHICTSGCWPLVHPLPPDRTLTIVSFSSNVTVSVGLSWTAQLEIEPSPHLLSPFSPFSFIFMVFLYSSISIQGMFSPHNCSVCATDIKILRNYLR